MTFFDDDWFDKYLTLKAVSLRQAIDEGRMEEYTSPTGQKIVVHSSKLCSTDSPCVFHNPSKHSMNDWPMNVRETGLIERLCVHGVGHPDPDSASFMGEGWDVHGCCGCCHA